MSNELDDTARNLSRDEMMSALFANMVFQNTNMALMMMGRLPNPSSNEKLFDLEAARMFIDQLEMVEVKTKGNLTGDEQKLLQQSLTHLRMAFVEAVEKGAAQESGQEMAGQPEPKDQPSSGAAADSAAADEESRKRFTKKY